MRIREFFARNREFVRLRCGRLHPRRNETTRGLEIGGSGRPGSIDPLAQPFVFARLRTYPDRNVTIVVTTAAGALTDTLTRAVAQQLSEMWKQSVIVENRSGAGYSIAAQSVMRGEHDGYTLLASETGFYTTQPHLYAEGKLAYDAEKDFVPVAGYGTIPTALLVNPSVPVNSVSDLIALAKKKPGAVTFGTAGVGSALHIAGLELESSHRHQDDGRALSRRGTGAE